MANAEFAIGSHAAEAAQKIWNSIEASGRYAFNKSHAVGYAIISTWEVWVKHYYPQEFVVALMATDGENLNKYVREARRLKIPVLPPDINRSDQKFTIEGPAIRYGIDSLRGIGVATGKAIQANRPYRSLVDYLGRAGKGASKGVVYNLIKIGAFDSLGDRKDLILELEYERCIEDLSQRTKDDPVKLVEIVNRRMANNPTQYCLEIPDFDDPQVIYEIENELVGNYITVDPMGEYEPMIAQHCISDPSEIDDYRPKDEFCIGGQLTGAKEHVIKKEGRNKGRVMAFLTVQWNELDFDITVFPELWEQTRDLLKVGVPVILFVARDDRGCHLKDMERLDLLRRAA
jgi:DNA polymerase-3 subunit alpha